MYPIITIYSIASLSIKSHSLIHTFVSLTHSLTQVQQNLYYCFMNMNESEPLHSLFTQSLIEEFLDRKSKVPRSTPFILS